MIDLREPNSGDEFTLADWRAIVRELRRLGKFDVATPLEMTDGPGGIGLSIAVPDKMVICTVGDKYAGGWYQGAILHRNATPLDETNNLIISTLWTGGVFGTPDEVVLMNVWEDTFSNHNIRYGSRVIGFLSGESTPSGFPIVYIYAIPNSIIQAVAINKTAGSNGSAGVQASWKYTVSDAQNATIADVPLTKSRPTGTATSDSAFGLAVIGNGANLFDAGEIYQGENA